jgi:hypothetical protein
VLLLPILSLTAQNVGIGTSSPMSKLHVSSNASADGIMIDNVGVNGDPVIQFAIDGMPAISMGLDDSDGDKFKIGTSSITSNTRLTLQSNGYLGIGTTSPLYNLHVTGTRIGDYVAFFQNISDQGGAIVGYSNSTINAVGAVTDNESGLALYAIHRPLTGAGCAIAGTSRSNDAVAIKGTLNPTTGSWLGYGGYFTGGIGYSGGLYNLSDMNAKKNIATLEGSLSKVMALRGVSYQYNTETFGKYIGQDSRTYTGFVAQEVESVLPEAVAEKYILSTGTNAEGANMNMNDVERQTVKVVDYVSLVPVLVEAIKEQQLQIERLEQKIKELEGQH